jgi:hypothetical protein
MPEPVEPFVKVAPPLFIQSSEVVHSKCDLLHFCAFIHILEVHDFNPPPLVTLKTMPGPPMMTPMRSTQAMRQV